MTKRQSIRLQQAGCADRGSSVSAAKRHLAGEVKCKMRLQGLGLVMIVMVVEFAGVVEASKLLAVRIGEVGGPRLHW